MSRKRRRVQKDQWQIDDILCEENMRRARRRGDLLPEDLETRDMDDEDLSTWIVEGGFEQVLNVEYWEKENNPCNEEVPSTNSLPRG